MVTEFLAADEASVYIHIPFCKKKCSYCHFYVIPDNPDKQESLFLALLKEWKGYAPLFQNKRLRSIYFGGGTPSLLDPAKIQSLIETILSDTHPDPAIEITLEANPEDIHLLRIKDYNSMAVNRISMGVQTTDDRLLHLLGRGHTGLKALDSVSIIADGGIKNISIDLMYDLPDQKLAVWKKTLEAVIQLPITHLSLYNLTIEPQTVFFKQRAELENRLPPPEVSLEMLQLAQSYLPQQGFTQYEISAFAKPQYHSIHNTGYWKGRPFIGLGPSAFSYWNGKRFRNACHFEKYCAAINKDISPVDFEEQLSAESSLRELIAIRLRLTEGFELPPELLPSIRADLERLKEEGYLEINEKFVHLSEKGLLFYDTVASEII